MSIGLLGVHWALMRWGAINNLLLLILYSTQYRLFFYCGQWIPQQLCALKIACHNPPPPPNSIAFTDTEPPSSTSSESDPFQQVMTHLYRSIVIKDKY